jgi:imidazolonepropionase-like amidohydrolase
VLTGLPGAGVPSPGYVVLSGGQVAAVGEGAPPGAADVVLADGYLAPGFACY